MSNSGAIIQQAAIAALKKIPSETTMLKVASIVHIILFIGHFISLIPLERIGIYLPGHHILNLNAILQKNTK